MIYSKKFNSIDILILLQLLISFWFFIEPLRLDRKDGLLSF